MTGIKPERKRAKEERSREELQKQPKNNKMAGSSHPCQ